MSLTAIFSRLRDAALSVHIPQTFDLTVAGVPLRFSASADLSEVLMPSLRGLVTSATAAPRVTITAWSGGDPIPELRRNLLRYPDKISVVNEGTIHLQFNPEGGILSCIDVESGEAFYHVTDPAALPDYEVCTPMRMLLNWHCTAANSLMLHSAAVGENERGVLIVGRSGAGKSTTALQCLEAGMEYLADDYLALERETGIAHHLYRGCKVMDDAFDRVPTLRSRAVMRNTERKKSVVILDEAAGRLVSSLKIVGIVRPRIANAPSSSFSALGPLQASTELAGTTIMQMPGVGSFMLRDVAALCRRIPTFEMTLGRDPAEIAAALRALITRVASS
jgi:hypothetical protein